ncbi:P27 family phage terminase small subunit [Gordonia sp. VNQ95]|uniref:P27 family phage terminase small subunit n=1 Tax=Gordonia sp. VNQ95 TaxID=3156619 RepID=UPI0032B40EBA
MADSKPPRPPSLLAKAGRALWRTITVQVADDGMELDARELELLRQACATADDLARIEAEMITDDRLVVKGSQGQPVAHPMLSEARACRAQIASLLARIDLAVPDETPVPKVTGPRSVQARRAANARWQGRGA